jgi:hypothetical protein
MKKVFFITLLVFIAFGVNAQKYAESAYYKTSDTIAASTTVYLYLDVSHDYDLAVISPSLLNVSGTSGVSYTLQKKVKDYWVAMTSSNCADLSAANDTITLITATAGLWVVHTDASELRVKCVADGTTQSSIVKAGYEIK